MLHRAALEQQMSNNSTNSKQSNGAGGGNGVGAAAELNNHDTPKKPSVAAGPGPTPGPSSSSSSSTTAAIAAGMAAPSPSSDDVARDAYKQRPRRVSIPLATKLPVRVGSAGRKSRDVSPGGANLLSKSQQSFDQASSAKSSGGGDSEDDEAGEGNDDDEYDDDDDDNDINPREKMPMTNTKGFSDFCVRNLKLASYGRRAIEVAESEMPAIIRLRELYTSTAKDKKELILYGAKIVACLHVVAQNAVLVETLVKLGAHVRLCACNVFSTQDEVAAALAEASIPVFGWKDENEADYWWCIEKSVKNDIWQPNLILDDGGDATSILMQRFPNTVRLMRGVAETSLTGIHRLYRYIKEKKLILPAINLVDCVTRSKFENSYCTREAIVECLKRTTGTMLSGKSVLVCGYGQVGKSIAQSMREIGAQVSVAEIDPICALQACMEGFRVGTIDDLVPRVNVIITCTGNRRVITRYHMNKMQSMTLLCNMGAIDKEIDIDALRRDTSLKWERVKPHVDHVKWPDGSKTLIVIAEGRVASACCSNIPSQALSVTAAAQLLALIELLHAPPGRYANDIYLLPKKFDELVARVHVESMGASLMELTDEQATYLGLAKDGPFKPAHYRY